jgi:hypothetical protein
MSVRWLVGPPSSRNLVLRQVHSLFQSEFFIKCESSVFSFKLHYLLFSLRSYSRCLRVCLFFLSVFPSKMCFRRLCLRKIWPIQLAFLHCILSRMCLSSVTLCNTSLFLTWLVKLILILLHISKLSRYFWSVFQSVHILAPYKSIIIVCGLTEFVFQLNFY